MTFVPHFEIVAADGAAPVRTAFVLHGIYGAGRNWRTFARDLVAEQPDWRVVLVDLRNHGRSQGAPPPQTLAACAADLVRVGEAVGGPPETVVGHSFGGKVALVYARDHGAALRRLWILDSPPGAAPASAEDDSEAGRVLATLREVAGPVARRSDAIDALVRHGVAKGIAQWLATNLVPRDEGGYEWVFDADRLAEMLADYWRVDGWPFLSAPPSGLTVDVVRAGRSDRWTAEDVRRLEALDAAGAITAHLLPDAAHWLHVDDPAGLRRMLVLG
ncbi:MAG: alpha/beta fold hydrolase [Planctomycetota bacterium JB042]